MLWTGRSLLFLGELADGERTFEMGVVGEFTKMSVRYEHFSMRCWVNFLFVLCDSLSFG
jgi:hypothetical protein